MEKTAEQIVLEGYFAGYMEKKASGTQTQVTPTASKMGSGVTRQEFDMWDEARKKKWLNNPSNPIPKWADENILKTYATRKKMPTNKALASMILGG